MRTFQSVPRCTQDQSSVRSVARLNQPQPFSLTQQVRRFVQAAPYIVSGRALRHRFVALSIPAALLVGTVLPSNAATSIATNKQNDVASIKAVPAASTDLQVTSRPVANEGVTGSIALGAPQANPNGEQVATPSLDAANIAMQYVGAPYRYGGASPRGFDCSGLTMYIYSQLGINLPHQARAQFNTAYGQRIYGIEDLAPGDLVFFAGTTRARGITHAAIYVGDGMMVSANTPRTGVQLVSINGAYWQSHYVGGIRPYR